MKTKYFFLVISVATLFLFYSCDKNKNSKVVQTNVEATFNPSDYKAASTIQSLLTDFHNPANNKDACPGWWAKVKKWIRAHTGTHLFNNCNGDNPCGPCAGICLSLGVYDPIPVDDNYKLTPEDIKNGDNVFILSGYKEDLMAITFVDNTDFVYEKAFYLPEDWNLGEKVAAEFGVKKIFVRKGVYPVIFDFNEQGETMVNIVWEK